VFPLRRQYLSYGGNSSRVFENGGLSLKSGSVKKFSVQRRQKIENHAGNGAKKKMMMDIVSIFESLQGEGLDVGVEAVFIRFAHCNRTCVWCDTDFETNFTPMSINQIVDIVLGFDTRYIVLTGGEPLIQKVSSLRLLCDKLVTAGRIVTVETNGTIIPDPSLFLGGIAVSPKLRSSGNEKYDPEVLFEILDRDTPVQIKFVIASRQDMFEAVEILCSLVNSGLDEEEDFAVIFQPEYGSQLPIMEIVHLWREIGGEIRERFGQSGRIRFLPQVHKLIGVE